MSSDDAERLSRYLTAKNRRVIGRGQLDDFDLYGIVATTVADTMLVIEGSLSIEDFKPKDDDG